MTRLSVYVLWALAAFSLLLSTALCVLSVEVHHPVPIACLLVFPIGWSIGRTWHSANHRRLIRRRRAAGQCLACGYDLCATPGCCPECGRIPSTKPHE
jgi:hypothetical protein